MARADNGTDEQPNVSSADDMPMLPRPSQAVFVQAASDCAKSQREVSPGSQTPIEPITIELPGSKYYTLRYFLNGLLAEGESIVRFPALSDDTAVLVHALRALGAHITWEPIAMASGAVGWQARILGTGGKLTTPPDGTLAMSNAGAVLRLLLALGALLPEVAYTTDHPESLGRRPNADLLQALSTLGITVEAQGSDGLLPISLRGGPPAGGNITVSGARSSQYLSALLYLAPLLPIGLDIYVSGGLRSQPLIHATLHALAAAGIHVEAAPDLLHFHVPGGQTFHPNTYIVPGDGPSAAALAAAALTLHKPLRLARLATNEADVQGVVAALRRLGATFTLTSEGEASDSSGLATLELRPSDLLHGARIDGDACIDSVPVLVAAACFAEGASVFEEVATLRLKESNRIDDLCTELQQAGANVQPGKETITIHGQPGGIIGGVTVHGHDDHRLVQALAIVATRCANGLTIEGADAVAKSYPGFFEALALLGAQIQGIPERRREAK